MKEDNSKLNEESSKLNEDRLRVSELCLFRRFVSHAPSCP